MAKRKVNKTALVREYMDKHPEAGPSEVSNALKAYKIPAGYVSNIKMKLKKGSGKSARYGRKSGSAAGDNVVAAAAFIKNCGGIDEARRSIEIAQEVARALEK
jgi:hypothetical protein